MAILLVEHDMDFVMELVDRIVVMEFGQKIAEACPKRSRTIAPCWKPIWAADEEEGAAVPTRRHRSRSTS
jgi:branched-chain amino acid transport system permease protein